MVKDKSQNTDTALGAALKAAVQAMSRKKQTELIADHIYGKYDVFRRFKPLAIGIDKTLVELLPQFDPVLIKRVLSNHCRRPRYLKALSQGGKRFGLDNKPAGIVSEKEVNIAKAHPAIQSSCSQTVSEPVQENTVPALQDKEEQTD